MIPDSEELEFANVELERSTAPSEDARRWSRLLVVSALGATLVLATLVRAYSLSDAPTWLDEQLTCGIARRTFGEILTYAATAHPPAYPLLARIALLLHEEVWVTRVPAMLGGVLGVWVVYRGVCRFECARVALLAASLTAGSVYQVYYSQEARGYTWMATASAACVFAAISHVRSRSPWTLAACLAWGVVACSFHYLALPSCAVAVGAALGADAFRSRGALGSARRARLTPSTLTWVAAATLAAGGSWVLRDRLQTAFELATLPAVIHVAPGPRMIAGALGRWVGLGASCGAPAMALAIVGCAVTARRSPLAATLLALATLAPFIAISVIPWARYFELRYLMAGALPAIALFAIGVDATSRGFVTWVARVGALSESWRAAGTRLLFSLALVMPWPVSIHHARNPRKFMPATATDVFGYRYVVLHSRLDPWLTTGATDGAIRAVEYELAGARWVLPAWQVATRAEGPDQRTRVRLMNSIANEELRLEVVPGSGRADDLTDPRIGPVVQRTSIPVGDDTILYRYANRFSGERLGETQLVGVLRSGKARFVVTIRSMRFEAVDAYLRLAFVTRAP